jgi:hypothetical protein
MRGESMKVDSWLREGKPWRGKGSGELRAGLQSKPLSQVTDFRVEQNPEDGGDLTSRGERRWRQRTATRMEQSSEERTPRADPVWNRTGRLGAEEGVKRLRKPEGARGRVR